MLLDFKLLSDDLTMLVNETRSDDCGDCGACGECPDKGCGGCAGCIDDAGDIIGIWVK